MLLIVWLLWLRVAGAVWWRGGDYITFHFAFDAHVACSPFMNADADADVDVAARTIERRLML